MRILYSSQSNPMIVDSVGGLNELHERLLEFLATDQRVLRVETAVSGSAAPYDEFLSGLVIEKADGPILVALGQNRVLTIRGSAENLSIYAKYFRFRADEDGSHHHPEYVSCSGYMASGTLSVIIEADGEYIAELQSES
jgi:hypothetical protein